LADMQTVKVLILSSSVANTGRSVTMVVSMHIVKELADITSVSAWNYHH